MKRNKDRDNQLENLLQKLEQDTAPVLQDAAHKDAAILQALSDAYEEDRQLPRKAGPVVDIPNHFLPLLTDARGLKALHGDAEDMANSGLLFQLHSETGKAITAEQLQLIASIVQAKKQKSSGQAQAVLSKLRSDLYTKLEQELQETNKELKTAAGTKKEKLEAERARLEQRLHSIRALTGRGGTSSEYLGYTLYELAYYYYGRQPGERDLKELRKRLGELQLLKAYRMRKTDAGEYWADEEQIFRMNVTVPIPSKINGKVPTGADVLNIVNSQTAERVYWLELAPVLSLQVGATPMLAQSMETPAKLLTQRLKALLAGLAGNKTRTKNPHPLTKEKLQEKLAGDIGSYYSKEGQLRNAGRLQEDWQEAVQACIDEKYIKEQALPSGAVIPAYEEKPNREGEIICIFGLNRTYLKDNGINTAGTAIKRRGRPKKAPAATTTPPTKKRGRPRKTAPQSGKK